MACYGDSFTLFLITFRLSIRVFFLATSPCLHPHRFNILLQIYQLARETVVLLLECNPDIGPLLDWVVDRCYTGTPEVADGCFVALATIFSAR
jgi:hypothetical protein